MMSPRYSLMAMVGIASVVLADRAEALSPKDIYKRAGPAVVLLLGSDDGKQGNGGTGSIVTGEGKVVTNAHVVVNSATGQPYKTLYVFLKPPRLTGDNRRDLSNKYKAQVLGYSPADELDLAVVQILNPPPNLPTVAFGNPEDVEIGEEVVAIGHPEQGGLWTLTTGTVSTVIANFNRVQGKNVFQTEASVNRGNSGGPLLDSNGNMIGINTMIARSGAGGLAITGVNFALKSSVAVKWLAGQGMGLAYAPKKKAAESTQVVVAMAPEAGRPAAAASSAEAEAAVKAPAKPATAPKPQPEPDPDPIPVEQTPPATIVVAEAPPKKPEAVRTEGATVGKKKARREVVKGKRLDPEKVNPTFHTRKRPYSLDDLRKKQMKEMEDLMDEMRGRSRTRRGDGLGLW